jgi:hypothetical protein
MAFAIANCPQLVAVSEEGFDKFAVSGGGFKFHGRVGAVILLQFSPEVEQQ